MKTFLGIGSVMFVLVTMVLTGCKTPELYTDPALLVTTNEVPSLELREGDRITISFPGAEEMSGGHTIRRDGKITLKFIGEMTVAGLTPHELEEKLIKAYGEQLLTKEVSVTVDSSSYPVFLAGAVGHAGKIVADRPLTVLEAIMEAGGFSMNSADLKHVRIIRQENGKMKNFEINIKPALQGKPIVPFKIQPHDIIYVPEKFNWF